MRHAKSDWNGDCSDFERPLNKRGKEAANKMGKFLFTLDLIPEHIASSPAKRAFSTAKKVARMLLYNKENIEKVESFYNEDKEAAMNYLRGLPNEITSVLMIGHNPHFEDLVMLLDEDKKCIVDLTTASIAVLEADINNWNLLDSGTCALKKIYRPKEVVVEL